MPQVPAATNCRLLEVAVTLATHTQVQEQFKCHSCQQCSCLKCNDKWHGKDTCEEAKEKKKAGTATAGTFVTREGRPNPRLDMSEFGGNDIGRTK